MILRCPGCNGRHLEYQTSDPEIRRCLECGVYSIVDDDTWQVGDKSEAELVDRPVATPSSGVAV